MILSNKKARFDYEISQEYEAGIVLEGWEVKSLRAGKGQLVDSYVLLKNQEAWLIGMLITPLATVSTHITPDPRRTRKLLLNHKELSKLIGQVERKGFTLVPLRMYWKNNKIKVAIALAQGKKLFDKRETEKNRDWQRETRQSRRGCAGGRRRGRNCCLGGSGIRWRSTRVAAWLLQGCGRGGACVWDVAAPRLWACRALFVGRVAVLMGREPLDTPVSSGSAPIGRASWSGCERGELA